MTTAIKAKQRGRKSMKVSDKVVGKPAYLTPKEWAIIVTKYGSPTKAMRYLIENQ